jgi:hypothetical protein
MDTTKQKSKILGKIRFPVAFQTDVELLSIVSVDDIFPNIFHADVRLLTISQNDPGTRLADNDKSAEKIHEMFRVFSNRLLELI